MTDNVTSISEAFAKAQKRKRKPSGTGSGGDAPPPSDGGGRHVPPMRLPFHSPVHALGVNGREYYFLNARGQFQMLLDKDIGRNAIVGMFGGDEYLREQWPRYARDGRTVINFDHGMMSPVLISSCHDKGIWSPDDNVRGVGTWAEDDGTLVMHCGDFLFLSDGLKTATGLRGKMLYPAAPPQPHPDDTAAAGPGGPADVLLKKLKSWHWHRGDLDAKLHLGWIGAGIYGAAPDWRPIEWITGGSGTGKSKLMKLTRWIFGSRAMIKSEDATTAGVKQRVRDTALPVSIDELESEGTNAKARDIVKLARIASSGGEALRGQPGGTAQVFVSRNTFQFSSIVIPSLPQQDKNRMAILSLDKVEWEGAKRSREPGEDLDEDEDEDDTVLGNKREWERVGRGLRGRALAEWHRYKKTLKAYRRALEEEGHNARGCDQFGALGAAYDCMMFKGFDADRARQWSALLPAATLPETSGYASSHQSCLVHLLGATIDVWKGGARESVARLLRQARIERGDKGINDKPSVSALEQIGVKIFRHKDDPDGRAWLIAISNTHPGLARIYRETDWSGIAGAPGAWAQMTARLDGAITTNSEGGPLRLRFDGNLNYCVAMPWETVFAPQTESNDDADLVNERDRE